MICIIRIAGEIGLESRIKENLNRLRLKKKYSCVVIENPNDSQLGMIKLVRDFVAFGEINDETYKKLKEARGKPGKKFFRLHPPRKGIDSKKHYGVKKGVLGNNGEKINDLILRML
ncbi:MAG: uL30 family ribosomal protein [Nanoarchaeota archaeon]